jgi:ribosomal protein L5
MEISLGMTESQDIDCPTCNTRMERYYGNQKLKFETVMIDFTDISGDKPRVINSKREIREIEKREGKVFGGHEELNQEAKKNMVHNKKAQAEKRDKELLNDCEGLLKRSSS